MVDIQKSIEDVEKNLGRELTDKEKQAAEMLGGFMNLIWEKADKRDKNKEER